MILLLSADPNTVRRLPFRKTYLSQRHSSGCFRGCQTTSPSSAQPSNTPWHVARCLVAAHAASSPGVQQAEEQQQQQAGQQQAEQQHTEQQPPQPDTSWLLKHKLSECQVCGGAGRVTCKDCSGLGLLPRGGYSKKNPLNLNRAVGESLLDPAASSMGIMGCATSWCGLSFHPKQSLREITRAWCGPSAFFCRIIQYVEHMT